MPHTTIDVRPEQPGDFAAIAGVVTSAFNQPNIARLVELIRASEHYVPDLSLVAVDDTDVVGHIMFSYATLRGGKDRPVLLLSPLAVRPDVQAGGIGGSLVREGIARAEARSEPLIVVEGIPAYYPRFGFELASAHGIEPPKSDILDAAFMVLRLSHYDATYRGQAIYPPAFDVT